MNDDIGESQKEENIEKTNHKTVFPESVSFPENSTDAVVLDVSDENSIKTVTTASTSFEISNHDNLYFISPKEAFDFETYSSTSVSITVTDKLENKETKSIAIIITDEDESVPPDTTDETESGSSKLPLNIELYSAEGSLSLTYSYQYDEQDRQTRLDINHPDYPASDQYTVTTYSGNKATTKTYKTQTNEQSGGYTVTTFK